MPDQPTPPAPRLSPPANLPVPPVRPTSSALPPPPAPRETPVSSVSVPMPPETATTPPPAPSAPAISSQLRTMDADILSMKTGQAPQSIPLPPGSPSSAPTPIQPISAPSDARVGISTGRKIAYGVLGVAILAGIAYSLVSLFSGTDTPAPVVSKTPKPSASTTATASPSTTTTVRNLRSYFGNLGRIIVIKDATTAVNDLRAGILALQPTRKVAAAVSLTKDGKTMGIQEVLQHLFAATPSTVSSLLGQEFLVVAYGQSEKFDATGTKTEEPTPTPRVVFIFEATDASRMSQALRSWESSGLDTANASLLGYNPLKRSVPGFNEGAYKSIAVRYANVPYADTSIGYAIVTASNNKNYLIIASSRESLFSIIDELTQ